MSAEEVKRFEKALAFHAAPTLMGVKCGSLLALSVNEYDLTECSALIEAKRYGGEVCVRTVSRCPERRLLFVYNFHLLREALEKEGIREFLTRYGYRPGYDTERCLDRLCERLAESDFPHEIGIFLGYPLEDVKGFIRNCGQRCKYCGVWKVYGDVERAKALFECYEQCRRQLCSELASGKALCNICQ